MHVFFWRYDVTRRLMLLCALTRCLTVSLAYVVGKSKRTVQATDPSSGGSAKDQWR